MIFRRRLLQVLVVMLLLMPPFASAQGTFPCPTSVPDCPADLWVPQPPVIVTIPVPPSSVCSVRVHYCARNACGIYNDMYIVGWELLSGSCIGVSVQDLINESMKAIWTASPNAWNQTIPNCPAGIQQWRVWTSGCYTVEVGDGGGGIDFVPCWEDQQCWARYKLCMQGGNLVKTLMSEGAAVSCPNEDIEIFQGGCVPTCPH